MPPSATAKIIVFPARTRSGHTLSGHTLPGQMATSILSTKPMDKAAVNPAEARLARALVQLNEAVTAQRTAMAAWQSSLGDLRTATRRLNTSLRGYDDTLSRLDARVATLRDEAAKLELWTGTALKTEAGSAPPPGDGPGRE